MNIVITGANRGLGYELLVESVSRGYFVYALVRSEEAKAQLLVQLQAKQINAKQFTVHICDVTNEADIASFTQQLSEQGIKLTSIINSAAILVARQTSIEQLDMEDVQSTFDTNLYGPMRVVKHLLPLLQEQAGSILNISSEAGSITNAYGGDYPYSLSKCALTLFSEQLKRTLAPKGIEVWSIHPGWMHTDMGGPAAPLAPIDSAKGIIDIMERKMKIASTFSFINYKGEAMDI